MTKPRIAVITGAFGALGSALAKSAASQGFQLALIDRAAAPPGGEWEAQTVVLGGVDLTREDEAARACAEIVERLGGVDVLFNVAGAFKWETIEKGASNTLCDLFLINSQTAANCSRAMIPHLKRSSAGRIINVGAYAALQASAGMGPYAASKSAVHQLTFAMAAELKGSGVTVNAVLPSIIDTPANRADMPGADVTTWVSPTDLAAVMLFLASDGAHVINGALIPVVGAD
jgi:NAD(P)-dependent dehydrogenase (short-subunit alcohol dehydrogenase family)